MRTLRHAAVLVLLPALAAAQDAGPADPTGALLLDALPPGADLVVHVPSLPRWLDSVAESGLGAPGAWREAFREQLRRWSRPGADTAVEGDPRAVAADRAARLVAAGERLLALADGEALVAGIELPPQGASSAVRRRAAVVAFRSSARGAELRAAVDEIIATGLNGRWPGAPRAERTMGREVVLLTAAHEDLWLRVEDGLVAASDHPIALGLFFRGLERAAAAARPRRELDGVRMRVRYGRADLPDRWEGMSYADVERVTWTAAAPSPLAVPEEAPTVVSLVADRADDFPVFPVRMAEHLRERSERMSARPLLFSLREDGTWDVRGAGAPPSAAEGATGAGSGISWLRAVAARRVAAPFDVDVDLLRGPLASAERAARDVRAVAPWRPTTEAGEMTGPAGSGPATFLALRTLRHAAHGLRPFEPPPEPPSPPPGPGGPGAGGPPSEPGEPPPKPGAPLPPPEHR